MAYLIPEHIVATRHSIASKYLSGEGIEIGALHFPLPTPPQAKVRFVDRSSVADLRAHYPELAEMPLVDVDVVDDGEKLLNFISSIILVRNAPIGNPPWIQI